MRAFFLLLLLCIPLCQAFSQAPAPQTRLLIRKNHYSLTVMRNDSVIRSYTIAIGKNPGDKQRRGDNRTPEGDFTIVQIQKSGYWTHDFGDGKGEIAGAYGPWFLRLGSGVSSMKWKGIGIHGTHDSSSLGTMASEGCIRMKNRDLEELKKLVGVGIPVSIVP